MNNEGVGSDVKELKDLLTRLQLAGVPMTDEIYEAFTAIDIQSFSDYDPTPFYHDRPLVFVETEAGGVKTISAPHMVCTLLHHLELSAGDDVLLLGAKGGYIAALISHIVGPEGSVTIVDPSRDVIQHVRQRLSKIHPASPIRVRKLRATNHTPPSLPPYLNKALVTGSLNAIPTWLEERIGEGGFLIAPMGGRAAQRLVKRERQGELFDTDLGGVLFGPVDISDSEPEQTHPEQLTRFFEEVVELARELDVFDEQTLAQLEGFTAELRDLDDEYPPIALTPDIPIWDEDEEEITIHDEDILPGHPLYDLLVEAEEWLAPLWPTLLAMLETELQAPGAPLERDEDFGFGSHEDLVP